MSGDLDVVIALLTLERCPKHMAKLARPHETVSHHNKSLHESNIHNGTLKYLHSVLLHWGGFTPRLKFL